eukprot:GEMP01089509.1.p1 GENE.GEMP01089509.1~~GEMP01089509.1.p1  ORF type:complete len:100 (-),score=3.05 GEMP01089509.1:114-413(-)
MKLSALSRDSNIVVYSAIFLRRMISGHEQPRRCSRDTFCTGHRLLRRPLHRPPRPPYLCWTYTSTQTKRTVRAIEYSMRIYKNIYIYIKASSAGVEDPV